MPCVFGTHTRRFCSILLPLLVFVRNFRKLSHRYFWVILCISFEEIVQVSFCKRMSNRRTKRLRCFNLHFQPMSRVVMLHKNVRTHTHTNTVVRVWLQLQKLLIHLFCQAHRSQSDDTYVNNKINGFQSLYKWRKTAIQIINYCSFKMNALFIFFRLCLLWTDSLSHGENLVWIAWQWWPFGFSEMFCRKKERRLPSYLFASGFWWYATVMMTAMTHPPCDEKRKAKFKTGHKMRARQIYDKLVTIHVHIAWCRLHKTI